MNISIFNFLIKCVILQYTRRNLVEIVYNNNRSYYNLRRPLHTLFSQRITVAKKTIQYLYTSIQLIHLVTYCLPKQSYKYQRSKTPIQNLNGYTDRCNVISVLIGWVIKYIYLVYPFNSPIKCFTTIQCIREVSFYMNTHLEHHDMPGIRISLT